MIEEPKLGPAPKSPPFSKPPSLQKLLFFNTYPLSTNKNQRSISCLHEKRNPYFLNLNFGCVLFGCHHNTLLRLQKRDNMTSNGHALISLHPNDLKFNFELDKQCYCDLKLVNNTEHHVAFKVKTTSPKKYFVRPNTSVIQPWDACFIRVTLQAQREYPPDMQSKDKFLIQSTVVPPQTDTDDLSVDTFNKDAGKVVEEFKLKVVYVFPNLTQDNGEDDAYKSTRQSLDNPVQAQAMQRIRNERDEAIRQTQMLQKDLELLKRQRYREHDSAFSLVVAVIVLIIGMVLGFLSRSMLSSSSTV